MQQLTDLWYLRKLSGFYLVDFRLASEKGLGGFKLAPAGFWTSAKKNYQ